MSEQKIEVVLDKQERLYSRNYHDFMDCQLLNGEEKIIYLSLKRFINVKLDNGQVYPTIETIQNMTGWGNKKVIKYIKSLVKKGVIQKKQNGLTKANLYTIKDSSEMWESENLEELKNVAEEENIIDFSKVSTELLEKELERRKKRNVPETSQMPTKAEEETDTKLKKQFIEEDYKTNNTTCQDEVQERYSLEQIKEYFCYEAMIHDNSCLISDIDSVMNILHDTLNTTKATIRISGEDKPTMSVIGKLMKLTHLEIMYAIEQYNKQTEKIKFSTNYMLKLLYVAKEQMHLDTANRVQYDMTHQNHQNQTEEVKEQQQSYEENQPVNQMGQAIEVCKNYSKEQEAEYKERYKKTALQGIKQEGFDNQGAISDLEKEWSKPNQGGSLPSEQQRTQQKEVRAMTKCDEIYNSYSQRQYNE